MSAFLAGLVVFLSSAAVLVLEILAGRLLAPYVGVSLETYTGIIGTVLAAISLGTWWGGRIADRVDPRTIVGPLLVAGGAAALLTLPVISSLGPAVGSGPLAIVTLGALGFFVPAAVLSAVSPAVVKLQLADLDETGRVVGRLSALGTAGAIAGTFLTGFVLLSALPTRPILLALGAALVVGGLALWAALARGVGTRPPVAVVLVAVVAATLTSVAPRPCEDESAYFCARVIADPARESGRTLVLDTLRHSYVDLADPTHLEFGYLRVIAEASELVRPGQPIDALHVGGGGFTFPRYLAAARPGSTSLVLELDATLVEVVRERLGLTLSDALRVRIGDARLGIREATGDGYDIVVGDAFGGRAVPWHLTTAEYATEVARVLRPTGMYAVNVIDSPPLAFVRAEVATLRAVFPHVAVIAPRERLEGRTGGNYVVVASEAPIPVDALTAGISERGATDAVLATPAELDAFQRDASVLTDDYAPVDQLLALGR